MERRSAQMAGALVLFVGFVACSTMTDRTSVQNIDDAAITTTVKAKLAADQARTLTGVDVKTVSGVVYLNGTVLDAAARQRAADLAREVDGVGLVVNNLHTRTSAAGDAPRHHERGYDTP